MEDLETFAVHQFITWNSEATENFNEYQGLADWIQTKGDSVTIF